MTYADDYTPREISELLAQNLDKVIGRLGLDGQARGSHFVALNPQRADRNLGSFRISLGGSERGRWCDFAMPSPNRASGPLGGDALDLVAYCAFGDISTDTRGKALSWARDVLGLPNAGRGTRRTAEEIKADEERRARRDQELDEKRRADKLRRAGEARAIWLGCEPSIFQTPVDEYLVDRGVDIRRLAERNGKLPGALRFKFKLWNVEANRHFPALVSAINGPHGVKGVQGIHRAWLERRDWDEAWDKPDDPKGERWRKARVKDARLSFGNVGGGYVPVWRGASRKPIGRAPEGDVVVIAEGVEDALSNAIARPQFRHLAAVSLGNIAAIKLPETIRTVIIGGENDQSQSALDMRRKAELAFLSEGRDVRLALPAYGKDSNDLMKKQAVR